MTATTWPARACNVSIALFYAALVWSHLTVAQATGRWVLVLPIVAQEALLVALFLTRRDRVAISTRPSDWLAGLVGTFLPLLLRPTVPEGPLAALGVPIQLAGLVLASVTTLSLGRSVGVVAANRGLAVAGSYRVVRHPMYAAYALSYLGYVATYPSIANGLITGATLAAFHARAEAEERLLALEARYRRYQREVRWRFVPFVY